MITQPELSNSQDVPARSEEHCIKQLPVLVLHAHNSCNCRCTMCDIWKTSEVMALQPADLEAQLNSIRALSVRWVVFTGGEPLLNRALPELCRMLRTERIHLTLLTTGILLKKYAREVVDSFDDVIVSLDGPEAVHDAIRRVSGGFAVMAAGIAALRGLRHHIRITARCTVQKANFQYLRNIVSVSKALNLNAVSFLPVDLTSRAFNRDLVWPLERQNEVGLSADDLPLLEAEISALIQENEADINNGYVMESPEKLRRTVRHFRARLGFEVPESPKCNAPWTSAVVEVDGTVRPCFFHAPIGNTRKGTLTEVINSDRAKQFRSNLDVETNPTCNRCVCSLNYRQ